MNKYLRMLISWFKLIVADDLVYKGNFIMKAASSILFDFFSPIIAVIIYSVSSGIPGWSFQEFLLMVGTFTLVEGFRDGLFGTFNWELIHSLRMGDFDMFLVRPFNTLSYFTVSSIHPRSFIGVGTGLTIVLYTIIHYAIPITFVNVLLYIFLVMLGVVFLYSITVLVGSLAIVFVKSVNLIRAMYIIMLIGRYPLNVYGPAGTFVFTFIFPLGIAAFYPASALLRGLESLLLVKLIVIILTFLIVNIFIWHVALRRYSSAGG